MFNLNQGATKFNNETKRPVPPIPPAPSVKEEDEHYFKEDYKVVFKDKDKPSVVVRDVIKTEIQDRVVIFISTTERKLRPMINKHNVVYPPKNTEVFNLDSVLYYHSINCNLGFNDEGGE